MKRTYLLIVPYISCLLVFLTSSCTSTRNVSTINKSPEMLIQENDILSVFISCLSPEASSIFYSTNNFSINSNTATGNAGSAAGYLVNIDGCITAVVVLFVEWICSIKLYVLLVAYKLCLLASRFLRWLMVMIKYTVMAKRGRTKNMNLHKINILYSNGKK